MRHQTLILTDTLTWKMTDVAIARTEECIYIESLKGHNNEQEGHKNEPMCAALSNTFTTITLPFLLLNYESIRK